MSEPNMDIDDNIDIETNTHIETNTSSYGNEVNKLVKKYIDDFIIEEYTDKYQNQVMLLGMKVLLEEVDEDNRSESLDYICPVFKPNLYKNFIEKKENNMWIIRNEEIVYGYVGVNTRYSPEAELNGLYIDRLLRGNNFNFAGKLIKYVADFAKSKKCTILKCDVDSYNKRALKFYIKCGFILDKIELVNDGKMSLYHYHLIL